jgi:hypothetical protein
LILTARREFSRPACFVASRVFFDWNEIPFRFRIGCLGETLFGLFYKTAVSMGEIGVKAKPCDSPKFQSSQLVQSVNVTT